MSGTPWGGWPGCTRSPPWKALITGPDSLLQAEQQRALAALLTDRSM
ncbi:hypothetical protein [Klenkia terrae]|uniref:Uncharacterized protein n=1 Tax=Klenkia terrae TaxID=1052259 RepID=A0ABU8E8G5_9ACTN|nr:hypothetical protein [Klenkia terrae]